MKLEGEVSTRTKRSFSTSAVASFAMLTLPACSFGSRETTYTEAVQSTWQRDRRVSAGRNDKAHWIEVGRCHERFALQATSLGIRTAFVNQPVEVAGIRPRLASTLGLGDRRPDLVVRFGRGSEMPRSLRRPVEAVLV